MPATPTRLPNPGETFAGRYDIQRQLGRGGMGVVYLANQSPLGRQVALKVLKPPESLEDDPNFDERFLREAAAAARLQHPNTITVYDFGQADDGALYIVMEYLEGNDLRTMIAHEGPFSAGRAIHVAKQVCKSLREAHRKGIIHRDLKPANVLLLRRDEDDDFVKVLDFGLVKFRGEESELTLAGKFLGSPRYTSPEALDRNRVVDHRADIYAVGILIYAMITGSPPFDGDPMQVLHAHLHETPRPMYKALPTAETTPELEALVGRCLAKEPDERFQSMADLLLALRDVGAAFGSDVTATLDLSFGETLELDEEPTDRPAPASKPRSPSTPTPRAAAARDRPARRRKERNRRMQTALVAGVGLVLVAILVVLLLPRGQESGLGAADPADIEVADPAYLQITVDSSPPGAAVRVGFDGEWTRVGETPLRLDNFRAPDDYEISGVRVELEGFEPVDALVPVDGGKIAWSGTLAPVAKAATSPKPPVIAKPEPKAAPKPETRPETKPEAKPTPTPKPKPKDDSLPPGYKDNPY